LFYSYHDIAGWDINNFELDLTLGAIFDFIVDKHDIPHLAVAKIEPQLGNIYYISSKARASIFTPEILQPTHFTIGNPYPNPFNAKAHIEFSVTRMANTSVRIYDITGKEVAKLIDQENILPGKYELTWDGKNKNEQIVSSGIYFFVFILEGSTLVSVKLVLFK